MMSKAEHDVDKAIEPFDYTTGTELLVDTQSARPSATQIAVVSAAEAIRFAIEDLPAQFLVGTYLEVGESRLPSAEIRRLYASSHYPLARKARMRTACAEICE
jgi:hypothetical protein